MNDALWRVKWNHDWCYIYLMLEFQSTQHPFMAMRMLTYAALLWEDLYKSGQIKAGDYLPPIFPIVLYNGDSPWKAPDNLSDQVRHLHPLLDEYQPKFKYYVLDQKRVAENMINAAKGDAAYIMRGEQAKAVKDIFRIAFEIAERSDDGSFPLHRAMMNWLELILTVIKPDWREKNISGEENSMLAELINDYRQKYKEEVFNLGMQAGKKEGEARGIEIGKARGIEIGKARGERKSLHKMINMALSAKFDDMPQNWPETITGITNIDSLYDIFKALTKAQSQEEFAAYLESMNK